MATSLRTEQEWSRQHPVPESTAEDILLSLWNFPVAKVDLAPEHRGALKEFLAGEFLQLRLSQSTKTELFLRGHASDTGDERANVALSRERAERVRRHLVSEGFPGRQISVEWAGSTEPADPGSSGFAAARNRRVDVVRFAPAEPERRPPIDIVEPPRPAPPDTPTFKPPAPQLSSASIEETLSFDFPTRRTPNYTVSGKIDVVLKLKAADGGGGIGGGIATTPDGKLAAKVEAEIAEHIKGKFTVEPNPNKPGVQLKLGTELSAVPLKPEIGFQTKETFIYVTFTFAEMQLAEFEAGGVRFTGTMTGKGKFEFAPGPAVLLRMGAVASPFIVAGLILGITVYGIEAATEEQMRFARLLAARQGIASRVAFELVGIGAEAMFKQRQLEWRAGQEGARLEAEFITGVNAINRLLQTPEERTAWTSEWRTKYAAGGNQDFETVRGRVFDDIGGQDPKGTIDDAVARVVGAD